ncbi:MAG: hypothetical protein M0P94_01495 [Candidatus Absconditabacterales bacterium]|nr:hypothetical protein [Candidatus Absconditabacterales bacterium]
MGNIAPSTLSPMVEPHITAFTPHTCSAPTHKTTPRIPKKDFLYSLAGITFSFVLLVMQAMVVANTNIKTIPNIV